MNDKNIYIYRHDLTLPPLIYFQCSGFYCEGSTYYITRAKEGIDEYFFSIHCSEVMFIVEIPAQENKAEVSVYAEGAVTIPIDQELIIGC